MKIMILGGSGFVGGHLARRLAADGHAITTATRYKPATRHLALVPGVRIRQFDPYNAERLAQELTDHHVLINLVGILNERGFGGKGFQRAHVELVEAAITACKTAGVSRFLQMSALKAGEGESYYLKTRGEGEQRVRTSGLNWTIFQPSTIFGPDDSFLNRFAGLLKISPFLPLARADAQFAPVYVKDVVEAMARTLDEPDCFSQSYQLCGAETWALKDLVQWVAEQRGLRRAVIGLPDVFGSLQGRVFDLVPGKPFSSDNFKSLKTDSLCTESGFDKLGIEPWGMSQKAPRWLNPNGGKQSRYQRFRRKAGRVKADASVSDSD